MNTILVVDDQKENVHLLRDRLKRSGFNILTAFDGPSGIEQAINHIPDLILLDVMMPGMSGYEVCEKLIENDITRSIPVILVTALTGPEDIQRGLEAGAYDYVKKPFNKTELVARINSALRFRATSKRLVEMEKINTFAATVVTANHEIKQPLTLINLSTAAIRRQIDSDHLSKEKVVKRIGIIEDATRNIINILDKLSSIKNPEFTDYINNLKMIMLENKSGA